MRKLATIASYPWTIGTKSARVGHRCMSGQVGGTGGVFGY